MGEAPVDPARYERLFKNFEECPEETEAEVSGNIPNWVKGTLLRNGPGMYQIGPDQYNHWFDGMALIQRFRIEDGKVYCNTKYLQSEAFKKNTASNRIVVSEFGTHAHPDPCKSLFKRYFSYFFERQMTDNDVVNFFQCGDEIWATSETPTVNRIDPVTMDAVERFDVRSVIAINSMTAHPHYDKDRNIYNMASANRDYCIVKIAKPTNGESPVKSCKIVARMPKSHKINSSYYHSFAMTENYVILPEMSLLLNTIKLIATAQNLRAGSFDECMEWHPEFQPVFHVCLTETGERLPIIYRSDPFFTFHHINAFEENDCLFVDTVAYSSGEAVFSLKLKDFSKMINIPQHPKAVRYVLPLKIPEDSQIGDNILEIFEVKTNAKAVLQPDGTIKLTEELISDTGFEFPRINYELVNGKKYQYCYGTGPDENTFFLTKVVKCDLENRTTSIWQSSDKEDIPGEPVFIANPEGTSEDEGIILVPVTNAREDGRDYLLVIDAQSFTEIARAMVKPRLPLSFHAHYVEGKSLCEESR